jgi:hypothetical protein
MMKKNIAATMSGLSAHSQAQVAADDGPEQY